MISHHSISSSSGPLNPILLIQLNSSLSRIRSDIDDIKTLALIPSTADDFQQMFIPHHRSNEQTTPQSYGLQHSLSAARNKRLQILLRRNEPTDPLDKSHFIARLHAITAPNSHTWTNTLPTESYLQLTDFQYKIATRTRLGLKPLPILPQTCADCQSPIDSHCDHFLTCVYRRKNELNIRHDQISNLIARIVKMVGGCATVEPLHLNRENIDKEQI